MGGESAHRREEIAQDIGVDPVQIEMVAALVVPELVDQRAAERLRSRRRRDLDPAAVPPPVAERSRTAKLTCLSLSTVWKTQVLFATRVLTNHPA